ncbi:hypothetical protein B9479_007568 [Cryptococcus floricola]|uniref:BTB domain-containing protein n=1 Tax=Cryptococcus floricola TaxID=2591691 RepID=A0A5D3APA4_9TREE|nr:hypothetical protein B9479_007568 [Cryptococcus floricola]
MAPKPKDSNKKRKTRGDATSGDLTPAASPVDPPLEEGWSTDGDTLLVSSDGTGFLVESYMLKAHSSVFRDMLSSNDLLPSYSSAHSERARLDLPEDTENAATVKTVLSILDDGLMLPALVDDLERQSIPVLDNVLHFAKKWDMPFLSNHVESILSKALQHPEEERLSLGDIFILAARSDLPHVASLAVARMSYWFDQSDRPVKGVKTPRYTHWWHPEFMTGAAYPCIKPSAFAMIPHRYMWSLLESGKPTVDKSERGDEFLQSIDCYYEWRLNGNVELHLKELYVIAYDLAPSIILYLEWVQRQPFCIWSLPLISYSPVPLANPLSRVPRPILPEHSTCLPARPLYSTAPVSLHPFVY